jgi:fatty-acyl-CoA synthase
MTSAQRPMFSDMILNILRRFPSAVAFVSEDVEWTYSYTEDRVTRLARLLRERGLVAGQGVGVLAPNRPDAWLSAAAAPLAGGRHTPLHPMGSLEDHLFICEDAELRFLLVDNSFAERAADLLERCASLEAVFTFDPSEVGEHLHSLLETTSGGRLGASPHTNEDTAWLLYTGGTTGKPKGVMLSERAVAQMAYSASSGWDLPAERRYLASGPISHLASMLIVPTMLAGGTTILQPSFDPERWLAGVVEHRPTLAQLVPTMIYGVLNSPGLAKSDLSSLQTVIYGASPMSSTRVAEAIDRIGPVFSQMYGQTEVGGIISSLARIHHDPSRPDILTSAGKAIAGNRVVLLDEDLAEVSAGVAGEVCVQGPSAMTGYFKRPDLTAEATRGGWVHTGDIATIDDEGFITIVDRKKEMIVSGGFNVFPREIEDVLVSVAAVSAAAVIGVPDEKWGEAVKAFVVPRPGMTVDVAHLISTVRDRKGPVYAPKSVEVVDVLPETAAGKPDKQALRESHWAGRARRVN